MKAGKKKVLQAVVETDGALALFLPGVHEDGDLHFGTVGVESAVLDLAVVFPAPGGLAGDAEGGMIEDPQHAAAGLEDAGAGAADFVQMGHVLDAEDGGDGIEFAESIETGGVAGEISDVFGTGVAFRFGDEGG